MELEDFLAATSEFLLARAVRRWLFPIISSSWLLTIPPHAVIYSRLAIDFRDENNGNRASLRPAMYAITMEMLWEF